MPSFGSRGWPLLLPLFSPHGTVRTAPPALGAGGALGRGSPAVPEGGQGAHARNAPGTPKPRRAFPTAPWP